MAASTISLPRSQRSNLNGPVPAGCVPNASPSRSTTSLGTILAWPTASEATNGANASSRVTCTVYRSRAARPATAFALPSRKSRAPFTLTKRSAAPDLVRGSRIRVSEYTTSSAVTSRPWWNLTPRRRVNVHVRPSREALQNSASAGATVSVWSYWTRPSKICCETDRL
ncbi:MAG: hypothetical protein A3D33_19975 [Candidatus Rokubacteria bacterium RIFCSPHIGHO2_02_FULL_73_26]|nr:MAG: hypothetical protein A3D33_19975 [Candidatus Rokubacteria bacterium RIFCSPHIGHO2_02_FULL_73_26]